MAASTSEGAAVAQSTITRKSYGVFETFVAGCDYPYRP
jgi:hypothetical protein